MTLSKALTVHVFDTEEIKLSRLSVGYHVKRLSFQALEKGFPNIEFRCSDWDSLA